MGPAQGSEQVSPAEPYQDILPDSTALLVDRYELTMAEAAISSGRAQAPSTFEVFARRLAPGRSYGVFAGVGRLVSAIERFRFTKAQIEYVQSSGISNQETIAFLRDFRFKGTIVGYQEGELYFPYSPVLTVQASFVEGLLLETLILSMLNFDSAIATAASRMRQAARGRPLIEMGSRRTHEQAALAAARAAFIGGFNSTSNMQAGSSFSIPTAGTVAHSFIMAYHSEEAAFQAQMASQGPNTTALVDTYNIEGGIRTAIKTFGTNLSAIRIDSGDPKRTSQEARHLLDALGATHTKIVVSGDLDEYRIAALDNYPIDAYGVGTSLVTGSGSPTANFVYKLVEIEIDSKSTDVAKSSQDKSNHGGRKTAIRQIDGNKKAEYEVLLPHTRRDLIPPDKSFRELLVTYIQDGKASDDHPNLDEAVSRRKGSLDELAEDQLALEQSQPAIPTVWYPSESGLSSKTEIR